jgi:hypothetical protein
MIGRLILYNSKPAVVVKNGKQLTAAQSDMNDHLGLWFGEVSAQGEAIVYTIPAEYVTLEPAPIVYRH